MCACVCLCVSFFCTFAETNARELITQRFMVKVFFAKESNWKYRLGKPKRKFNNEKKKKQHHDDDYSYYINNKLNSSIRTLRMVFIYTHTHIHYEMCQRTHEDTTDGLIDSDSPRRNIRVYYVFAFKRSLH